MPLVRRCPDVPSGEVEHDKGPTKSPRCPHHRKEWADYKRALRDAKTPAEKKKIRYEPTPRDDADVTTTILPEERDALRQTTALLQARATAARKLWLSTRPEARRQQPWTELEPLIGLAEALTVELTGVLWGDPRRVQRVRR